MSSASRATVQGHQFLFLLASARLDGNSETLARRAAGVLEAKTEQKWMRLSEIDLPPFQDIRHIGTGIYAPPIGEPLALLNATLWATDIVIVAPVYWYSMPASAKLYFDHWSGWRRIPDLQFKARMARKRMWLISCFSSGDDSEAGPMVSSFKLIADYMDMRWAGEIVGHGNRPGDVFIDQGALAGVDTLFSHSLPS